MDNAVEEIKNRLDIAEVIQEYIRLTKAGANYKANCPFHSEKTPSFMVSPDKQIYHCFGCGEGGDVFGFIQKMEGVDFPEALRILAQKAGVKLQPRNPKLESKKTKLFDINRLAAAYFNKVLQESSQAQVAREYLEKRNISQDTIDLFQLGFAVDDWEALNTFLKKKGFTEEQIFDAGLTIKKDRGMGYLDRFRGRLMFPLADVHGQVVGFSGRVLNPEEKSAKYVNTPQTVIYNKSAVLYALHRAKNHIQKQKLAVVVEGQMDVLASHQAGIENVVASGGTALTEGQVRLMKRYCSTVALAFDMDVAGAEAVRRGLEIAWQYDLETKVVELPFGKDPDECIQKDPSAWKKAIAEARPFMDYYFDKTVKDVDLKTVQGKKQVAKLLLPLISRLPDQIEQTHYLQKLSATVNVEEKFLRDQITKSAKPARPTSTPTAAQPVTTTDRAQKLSELVIGIAMEYPENIEYIIENFKPELFKGDKLLELYKNLVIYYTETTNFELDGFYSFLAKKNSEFVDVAKTLCLYIESEFAEIVSEDPNVIKKALIDAAPFLKGQFLSSELKKLEQELKHAEESKNQDKIRSLSEHITSLTEELGQLT